MRKRQIRIVFLCCLLFTGTALGQSVDFYMTYDDIDEAVVGWVTLDPDADVGSEQVQVCAKAHFGNYIEDYKILKTFCSPAIPDAVLVWLRYPDLVDNMMWTPKPALAMWPEQNDCRSLVEDLTDLVSLPRHSSTAELGAAMLHTALLWSVFGSPTYVQMAALVCCPADLQWAVADEMLLNGKWYHDRDSFRTSRRSVLNLVFPGVQDTSVHFGTTWEDDLAPPRVVSRGDTTTVEYFLFTRKGHKRRWGVWKYSVQVAGERIAKTEQVPFIEWRNLDSAYAWLNSVTAGR